MRYHERMVMLSVIDGLWKEHLLSMDHLKEGIGLRGYAQQDPLVAYKKESFDLFEAMMARFQEDTVRFLFRMQIIGPDGQPIGAPVQERREVPSAPPVASAAQLSSPDDEPREISIPTRQTSTTIDALEKEFHRKKQKELEAATRAGAGDASETSQRRTGEKVLHVSPWMAEGIEGMETPEGEALLQAVSREIFALAKTHSYFHAWKPTDMLIWDNWRVLHAVSGHDPKYPRRMQRTTIKGDYGLGYFEGGGTGSKVLEMTF